MEDKGQSIAIPAGVWLKQSVIDPENVNIGALAEKLLVTRQTLSAILNGRSPLTPALAVRVEKVLGVKADSLMKRQGAYEMAQAREAEKSFEARRMIPRRARRLTGAKPDGSPS